MKAITQYNNLMFDICREYNTIGTSYSENTDGWTLRDMVSEVQYTLDVWNEPESMAYCDAHDECQPAHKPWYKNWLNEKARMKRFIDKYKNEAMTMKCKIRHCSIYD